METGVVANCISDTIPVAQHRDDDCHPSLLAPEKSSSSERQKQMHFSFGGDSSTIPAKLASTALSSATNQRIEVPTSFDRRTRLLIASGLVAGITPMSIRRECGAEIPDFVSSWRGGADAGTRKAGF